MSNSSLHLAVMSEESDADCVNELGDFTFGPNGVKRVTDTFEQDKYLTETGKYDFKKLMEKKEYKINFTDKK